MDADALVSFVGSTLRATGPLLAACLAGLWSERSGIVDVGLEGKMLVAAFAAAAVASVTGRADLGLAAAVLASGALAALHGFISMERGGNQIVSGMAINLIAAGGTAVCGAALFGEGGRTPALAGAARITATGLPPSFAEPLGPLFRPLSNLVSAGTALTWAAFFAVAITAFVLGATRYGLRLSAAGENPHALAASGVRVRNVRFGAVIVCGVLCGLAGADLSLAQAAGFLPGMTAGKGFIALAALVLAKWRPLGALGACLLFGALDAAAIRLQGLPAAWAHAIPVQFVQALPYVLTLVLLAGFVGRSQPPAAAGTPYAPET